MSKAKHWNSIALFLVGWPLVYLGLVGTSFSLYGRGYISLSTLCKVQWLAPGFGFNYYIWWQRNIGLKASATIE
jgi:hypothetical protein